MGVFGLIAGIIVVAMVGRYGYVTSDTVFDGIVAAFFFAVIAVGGIAGPAVALHLLRTAPGWGTLALIVALAALVANLSNSLGAIAGRADRTLAERSQAKDSKADARADLLRLTKERAALAFSPATADNVDAAKAAVAAAERVRKAECARKAPNACRSRETAEQTARATLATVLGNKAMTDRAHKLDQDIAGARSRIEKAPAVASVDPRAELLARLLSVATDTAATGQQVATVVVVELLIAFALIAWELLGRPLAPAQEIPTSRTPEPEKAAPERPAQPQKASAQLSKKSKRGRPAKERLKAEAKVIDLLKASGGKLSKNSTTRKLGRMANARKSTMHLALAALLASGVIVKVGGGLALTG